MEKDYKYYAKKKVMYGIMTLLTIVPGMIILFILAYRTGNHQITMGPLEYFLCGLCGVGVVTFFLAMRNERLGNNILRKEANIQKKKDFNNIITLIKEDENQKAIDALYEYDNKYK